MAGRQKCGKKASLYLFQVHLREPAMLFRFLCVLWGYGSNHGDQLDVKVGAVLQTQALYMGRALLSVQPAATLAELAAANSPGKKNKYHWFLLLDKSVNIRAANLPAV